MRVTVVSGRLTPGLLMLLFGVLTAAATITPVPLSSGANSGFSDAQPEDRQGGWIDAGGNDLRALKAGNQTAAGVPFEVADGAAAGGKSCIVLGGPTRSYLPSKATVPVPSLRGEFLYLLHAAAWCPPAKAQSMVGVLFIDYADDSRAEIHVRSGRDAGDWTSPESHKNAARGWTAYNGNTQVSLFVSRFEIKKTLPIKAVRFESRDATWMIAAISLGDETALKPIKADLALDRTFVAPPALAAPLQLADESKAPKNIVLLIGDGMGPGALQLASLYQHKAEGRLFMEQLPVASFCTTLSLHSNVTDSAAAATAIACGAKTGNGAIGLLPDNRRLTPFTELARQSGRAVGLITSDALTGATPAGFYAHVATRGAYPNVAEDAARCGYDVLIGNTNGRAWFSPQPRGGQRTDSRDLLAEMTAAGYAVFEDLDGFKRTPADRRALGFMSKGSLDSEQCLAQLTETALGRLSKNTKGFFLMVECAITDAGGHGNKPELTVRGVLQVDWAARAAADFAAKNKDTLVLVTADHETGGLSSSITNHPPGKLVINYTTTSHTGVPVRLFAYGPGAHLFKGAVDNTDIAKNICRLWSLALPPPR